MSSFSEEKSDDQGSEIEFEQQDMSIENQSQQQVIDANKKLDIEQNEKDLGMGSYVFYDEGHTLGNPLRYVLTKNPYTELCGYSIPHPSENKMIVRLQCLEDKKSNQVLKQGFYDLQNLCINMRDKLNDEIKSFNKKQKKAK